MELTGRSQVGNAKTRPRMTRIEPWIATDRSVIVAVFIRDPALAMLTRLTRLDGHRDAVPRELINIEFCAFFVRDEQLRSAAVV